MTTWVVLVGLPGVGKSTLACALEGRLNSVTLNKDRVRSVLFPGELTDYTQEQDDLCMRAMLAAAAYLTEHRQVDFIVFDGRTFSQRRQIEEVVRAAGLCGASWRILHVTCSKETAEARLARGDPSHPARNRSVALYREIEQTFEPVLHAKLDVDTTLGVEAVLDAAQSYLMRPAEGGAAGLP